MKKHLVYIFIFLSLSYTHAQFKPEPPRNIPQYDDVFWQWGYYFGMTFFDFKARFNTPQQEISVYNEPGFNVGLISDFRLTPMLSFRTEPGLYFSTRKIVFNNISDPYDRVRKVNSNYVLVPLLFKFNSIRNGNIRPYVTGGIVWGYNLSSYENSVNDNSAGVFRMKRENWYWSVGIGFEMYMYYFKFTPSVRGIFAINNEFVPDNDPASPWTSNLEYVGTRGIYITLTFE